LFPGVGYGGSCFPKDVRALEAMARNVGVEPHVLAAVTRVNERQKKSLAAKIARHFAGRLAGQKLAIWGLAFKPRTDDVREAPALAMIDSLLAGGAELHVHDPEAMPNVRRLYFDRLQYCDEPLDALSDAAALVILTEWKEFQSPDLVVMRQRMRHPVIFDGRNLFEPQQVAAAGFTYYSIGRRAVGLGRCRPPDSKRTDWRVNSRDATRRMGEPKFPEQGETEASTTQLGRQPHGT
jgi:UDPglucose 6-dehydrogenase